jgi:hypothetical protein
LEIGETARLIGPKRCGFNSFSSDFAGQIADTKKPAGLAPCGLSGLLRMTLESSSKDFGGLGGFEPPSEIPTYHFNYRKNNNLY